MRIKYIYFLLFLSIGPINSVSVKIMNRFWIIMFCCFISNQAQSQIGYEFTIGNDECNQAFGDIAVTNDNFTFGTYFTYCPFDTTQTPIQTKVYKIWPSGDTSVFSYSKMDTIIQFLNIITIDNGNLLLAGEGYSIMDKHRAPRIENTKRANQNNLQSDYNVFQWYCLMTPNFEVVWERGFKNIADSLYTINSVLSQINPERYIYVANVVTHAHQWPYMYLFEFNINGDSLFHTFFTGEETSKVYSITTSINMEEIHLHKNYWEFGSFGCSFLRMDTSFNSLNTYIYPSDLFQEPFYTVMNNLGEFISLGWYFKPFEDEEHLGVIKFDTAQGLLVQNNLTPGDKRVGPPWHRGIDYYYPDRIYVAGVYNQQIYPYEPNNIYVACLNSDLEVINEQYIEGEDYFEIMAIEATPDGGVVIAGRVDNLQIPGEIYNAYIIKLDSSMFVGIREDENLKTNHNLTIYPNPAENQITIEFSKLNSNSLNVEIIDELGRTVKTSIIRDKETTINIDDLRPGIYYCKVSSDRNFNVEKFIKH